MAWAYAVGGGLDSGVGGGLRVGGGELQHKQPQRCTGCRHVYPSSCCSCCESTMYQQCSMQWWQWAPRGWVWRLWSRAVQGCCIQRHGSCNFVAGGWPLPKHSMSVMTQQYQNQHVDICAIPASGLLYDAHRSRQEEVWVSGIYSNKFKTAPCRRRQWKQHWWCAERWRTESRGGAGYWRQNGAENGGQNGAAACTVGSPCLHGLSWAEAWLDCTDCSFVSTTCQLDVQHSMPTSSSCQVSKLLPAPVLGCALPCFVV